MFPKRTFIPGTSGKTEKFSVENFHKNRKEIFQGRCCGKLFDGKIYAIFSGKCFP